MYTVIKMNEKYRPSNGSDGDAFTAQYCNQCAHDAKYRETNDGEDGCLTRFETMLYDIKNEKYPKEWIYDKDGKPACTKFLHESEQIIEHCEYTKEMFPIAGS